MSRPTPLRLATASLAFSGVVAVACSGPTSLDLSRYDRSCATASDCVAVTADACCGCPNAAIAASQLDRYEADLWAAARSCGACTEKPCLAVVAACVAGECTTGAEPEAGPPDAADDGAVEAAVEAGDDGAVQDAAVDGAVQDAAGDAQDASSD